MIYSTDDYNSNNTKKNFQTIVENKSENDYFFEFIQDEQNMRDIFSNFAGYDHENNELYYEKSPEKNEEKFVNFVKISTFCLHCKQIFFKNKLHNHLCSECSKHKSKLFVSFPSIQISEISAASTFQFSIPSFPEIHVYFVETDVFIIKFKTSIIDLC